MMPSLGADAGEVQKLQEARAPTTLQIKARGLQSPPADRTPQLRGPSQKPMSSRTTDGPSRVRWPAGGRQLRGRARNPEQTTRSVPAGTVGTGAGAYLGILTVVQLQLRPHLGGRRKRSPHHVIEVALRNAAPAVAAFPRCRCGAGPREARRRHCFLRAESVRRQPPSPAAAAAAGAGGMEGGGSCQRPAAAHAIAESGRLQDADLTAGAPHGSRGARSSESARRNEPAGSGRRSCRSFVVGFARQSSQSGPLPRPHQTILRTAVAPSTWCC